MNWVVREGFVLAKQALDSDGKVAGEARGKATVVKECALRRDEVTNTPIYEGDEILFFEYGGHDVKIDGEDYLVIQAGSIFASRRPQ